MDEFSFDDIEARLEESRILGAELLGLHIGSRPKRKLLPKLRDARQANDVEQYANLLDESGMHLMHEGRFYSATRALRLSLQVKERAGVSSGNTLFNLIEGIISSSRSDRLVAARPYLARLEGDLALYYEGRIAMKSGNTVEAARCLKQAAQSFEEKGAHVARWTALNELSEVYRQTRNLDKAEQVAREALAVAEAALMEVEIGQRRGLLQCIARSADLLINLYREKGLPQALEALGFAEHGRARALLSRLGEDIFPQPEALPVGPAHAEAAALNELRMLKEHVQPRLPIVAHQEDFRRGLEREARVKLWSILDDLPPEWDQYARLRRGQPLEPLAGVTALVKQAPRTQVVAYHAGSESLSTWWFDQTGVLRSWNSEAIGELALSDAVRACVEECSSPDGDYNAPVFQALSKICFGTIIDQLNVDDAICIIPSGPLFNMPFGALRHNGRFLAEDFSLSVVPSLSVAGGWASFPQPLVRPQATVLGNSLEDLQYASREAELVASMFQAAPLLGGDVMRAFINLASAEASILHVAGHIKFDEAIPEMSGIILADRTIMSVKDLSQSRQELALVVLSGCDSGKSFVTYGDNPISLGLSFLHTGARAVVFTLWEIDDIVTVDLMRNFYRVLLTGKSVDTALQMAQCALIKKRSKHPYYWAAFQMLGERIKLFIARKRNDSFNMRKVLHRFFR